MAQHIEQHDVVLHAGDWGDIRVYDQIAALKPVIGVYGNIDGQDVRMENPKVQQFTIERCVVLMTHIGGYPGKYNPEFAARIKRVKPHIVITGHSHILKVMYDKTLEHLHINPGAIGNHGFHHVRTMVSIEIDHDRISNARVIELKKFG